MPRLWLEKAVWASRLLYGRHSFCPNWLNPVCRYEIKSICLHPYFLTQIIFKNTFSLVDCMLSKCYLLYTLPDWSI
nr:MAG TPA: hypothetical protein [Caudoviricetes sp.]